MQIDLTKGKPLRLLVMFAAPIFISNVFQQLYNSVDAMIVGRLIGGNALAAVGITIPIIFLINGFLMGLGNGFSVLTAQLYGGQQYDRLSRALSTGLSAVLAFTVFLTIAGLAAARPLLILLHTPEEILPLALQYLRIITGGLVCSVFYNQISGILRGLGNAKAPLIFLIFSSVCNIILDYIFVAYCRWGIAGAATATVLVQGIASVLCFRYLRRQIASMNLKWKFEFEWDLLKTILRFSVPMALQQDSIAIGLLLMQGLINTFGPDVITAFTAGSRIDLFSVMPLVSLGAALSTYSAQNYGAAYPSRIRQGFFITNVCVIIISIILSLAIVSGSKILLGLFVDAARFPGVIAIGRRYLTILPLFYVFLGLTNSLNGVLSGTGNLNFVMLSTCGMMAVRFFMAKLLIRFFVPDYLGVFWSWPASWILAWLAGMIRYRLAGINSPARRHP
jgi:putative MATE family efflux protein